MKYKAGSWRAPAGTNLPDDHIPAGAHMGSISRQTPSRSIPSWGTPGRGYLSKRAHALAPSSIVGAPNGGSSRKGIIWKVFTPSEYR